MFYFKRGSHTADIFTELHKTNAGQLFYYLCSLIASHLEYSLLSVTIFNCPQLFITEIQNQTYLFLFLLTPAFLSSTVLHFISSPLLLSHLIFSFAAFPSFLTDLTLTLSLSFPPSHPPLSPFPPPPPQSCAGLARQC